MSVDPGPMVVRGDRFVLAGVDDAGRDGARGRIVGPVAAAAALRGVSVVFVVGEPPAELWGSADAVQTIGGEGAHAWRYRVTVPGGAPVSLVLLSRDEGAHGGPWTGLSGQELVDALRALRGLLGVPWGHSVGRTGEHLILSTHPRHRGGVSLDRSPDVPEPARPARLEQPWQAWQRPMTAAEESAGWVHVFDANAAFLGPWQSTELGFGRPEHFGARGCETRLQSAGVWRVELPAGWHDGEGLPPIAPGLRDGRGWVTSPTLSRLREWSELQGFGELLPAEGWVWPRRSRFLRAAGERLRDARAAAMNEEHAARTALAAAETEEDADRWAHRVAVAGAVKDAVRDVYTITVGRLSSAEGHIAAGWRRPDWGNTIRAAYRVSLHRKLTRWTQAPVAVMTDAVAFLSDVPEPAAFAESIGLAPVSLGPGLGQFKHLGTAPAELFRPLLGAGPRKLRDAFDVAASHA